MPRRNPERGRYNRHYLIVDAEVGMISESVVEWSQWQFAITAMLHFLFIPLTLGLSVLLAILETTYVLTGNAALQSSIRLWSRIFAIDFVLALSTRLIVIFQFGTNGSYFSHYVGDIFALPLAIEALTSFFIASSLFGPYWFGWIKLGKYQHLTAAWLIAIAVHISAYWIMLTNAWMQNPLGAEFNHLAYRMELIDFTSFMTNPIAFWKFMHTATACHAAAASAILAISAHWLLRTPQDDSARRSFKLAAAWGLIAIVTTIAINDPTPFLDNPVQKAKLAAVNGEINPSLRGNIESRVRNGILAYRLLQDLRDDNKDPQLLADFESHKADLGYALLVKPWHKSIVDANDQQIKRAVESAMPGHPALLYWANRMMIGCGAVSLLLFSLACWNGFSRNQAHPWLMSASIYLVALPWLACIAGWFVAEAGKQPWAIAGVLPTFVGVSSLTNEDLILGIAGYALAYAALLAAGWFLLRQTINQVGLEPGTRI